METKTTSSHYVTTKEASKISGYNSTYLGQLCKEGKIAGEKKGRSWNIDSGSLKAFVLDREERRKEIANQLAAERLQRYRDRTFGVQLSRVLPPGRTVAVALAVTVLAIGAIGGSSAMLTSLKTGAPVVGLAAATTAPQIGFAERFALFTYRTVNGIFSSGMRLASLFGHSDIALAPSAPPSGRSPPGIVYRTGTSTTQSIRTQVINQHIVFSGISEADLDTHIDAYLNNSLPLLRQRINQENAYAVYAPQTTVISNTTFSTDNLAITNSSFSGTSITAQTLALSGAASISGSFSAATSTLATTTITSTLTLSKILGLTQCLHVDALGNVSGTGVDCGTSNGVVSTTSPNTWIAPNSSMELRLQPPSPSTTMDSLVPQQPRPSQAQVHSLLLAA